MEREKAHAVIEAVLFAMGDSVEISRLAEVIEEDSGTTREILEEMSERYDKDNRGRMKTFTLRLETVRDEAIGQYLRMFMVNDDGSELRIFPLFDFGSEDAGSWVDYGDDGPTGTAYRETAERFNTSIFKPSKWRVDRIVIDYDSTSAYIQTSAFGIIVDTETTYNLYIEDGLRKMSFTTTSESSLAESVLFHNPNPGEGDAFILTEI